MMISLDFYISHFIFYSIHPSFLEQNFKIVLSIMLHGTDFKLIGILDEILNQLFQVTCRMSRN